MTEKRIVFLDYVRVFACFLVMLVHASENFYPGPGATDMAGPQSLLANETDRLWVSLYDGFSRMSVPLFMIVSAFLLVPMKPGQTAREFYKRRFTKILPPFLIFAILYSTLPMLWGQIDATTALRDLARIPLNFPTLAGHLWFMFPLFGLYLFIPVISPWLEKAGKKEERFFILLFLISTCIPYLNRWFGEVWGQCFWNEYHLLWYFSGYLGYLVLAHYIRVHLDWSRRKKTRHRSRHGRCRSRCYHTLLLCASHTGRGSRNSEARNRLGVLHNQCRLPHSRNISDIQLHRAGNRAEADNKALETELRNVLDAHLLVASVVRSVNPDAPSSDRRVNSVHRGLHIHLLRRHNRNHIPDSGK